MSIQAIQKYLKQLDQTKQFGGTSKETAVRSPFWILLNEYAQAHNLMVVTEVSLRTKHGDLRTPDGTLKDSLRQDWGYWEAKDEKDNLDDEIRSKLDAGYPDFNILFEDSIQAVLIQNGVEVGRVNHIDMAGLDGLLKAFVTFERQEVKGFRTALELFAQDVPKVTETLRGIIDSEEHKNPTYKSARTLFWDLCKEAINPAIGLDDIKEMMVQHILTADIFNTVFDEPHFHRENNIAKELEKVLATFFTGNTRRIALGTIQHYYQAIKAAAAQIADHHEKQRFLKVLYETFYKSYNPKAADRLGVVYTPNEIVRFMVCGTNHLLYEHFGKFLEDEGVDILDPATGTGTFICDIIDFIRSEKLPYKYQNELHANEIAILPYYIANLNIEFTYKQKMNLYHEFENLCFVDTLDNMGFDYKEKQMSVFSLSAENALRIQKQNKKKISVIIGNPPYNANQQNENDNNKNRVYEVIDKRIKDTFIKYSTAQKTKVYDMYSRFYRWAFDRLGEDGIIAFVTNRSFIDSRTFDGFRKVVQDNFDNVYIIDTQSDVRSNPKISGTANNVFGIQTGVAVMFLVRKKGSNRSRCKIQYFTMTDEMLRKEKLEWFAHNYDFSKINFDYLRPDKTNNWVNLANDNDWDTLLPLINKLTKRKGSNVHCLFNKYSTGVSTNRDEWVYDFSRRALQAKIQQFTKNYNRHVVNRSQTIDIKWSRNLKNKWNKKRKSKYDHHKIVPALYRPFTVKSLYLDDILVDERGAFKTYNSVLGVQNRAIAFSGVSSSKTFHTLASSLPIDLHATGDSQCLPLMIVDSQSNDVTSNITPWAKEQFADRYPEADTSDEAIFYYVYATLHNPAYRKKYELNLKRDFPRIPFYDQFDQWVAWGKELMDLHIDYEKVEPWGLSRIEQETTSPPKARLKAEKEAGAIILDDATTLTGIPDQAWDYMLGARCALEWILDQYKEKMPKDPVIREHFDTYRFADHKEQVIDLLDRVCRVSVRTIEIQQAMESFDK